MHVLACQLDIAWEDRPANYARAVENQAFVVGVNRAGRDPRNEYAGGSIVVGPDGEVLAEAGPGECCLSVEIDAAAAVEARREFPALRDMR